MFVIKQSVCVARTTRCGATCACWRCRSACATWPTSRTTTAGSSIAVTTTCSCGRRAGRKVWTRRTTSVSCATSLRPECVSPALQSNNLLLLLSCSQTPHTLLRSFRSFHSVIHSFNSFVLFLFIIIDLTAHYDSVQ